MNYLKIFQIIPNCCILSNKRNWLLAFFPFVFVSLFTKIISYTMQGNKLQLVMVTKHCPHGNRTGSPLLTVYPSNAIKFDKH